MAQLIGFLNSALVNVSPESRAEIIETLKGACEDPKRSTTIKLDLGLILQLNDLASAPVGFLLFEICKFGGSEVVKVQKLIDEILERTRPCQP